MELQIKLLLTTITFLFVGVFIGFQIPKESPDENLVVPFIVQPECVEDISVLLNGNVKMYHSGSDIDFAPSIQQVIIYSGSKVEYIKWVNSANEITNECGRKTFINFDVNKHFSPELRQAISKLDAKNLLINGDYVSVYFEHESL
ncbi:hypothetical protein [Ferrimonas senticii]|uniref:hypothetical protein n=1 Tax=Ferrimonas senticii TaxID=394566 RepID=UPI000488F30A|nr:hypothetical protein [Ferrimonas senticii]